MIGYLVIAPNLLSHACRTPGSDFRIQTLADDLLPYFEAAEYDIVIGHSVGGLVVLSLLKYLPKTKPTSVVVIDAAVELSAEEMVERRVRFSSDVRSNHNVEDYMALNPLWTREDAIWRVLGTQIGRPTNAHDHIDVSLIASSIQIRLMPFAIGQRAVVMVTLDFRQACSCHINCIGRRSAT
jgi:pimeloyl-ACP methyl ester carboxylesterase